MMLVIPTFLVTNGDGCISWLHKSSRTNSIEMTNIKMEGFCQILFNAFHLFNRLLNRAASML